MKSIRQIAFVARDLEPVEAHLTAVLGVDVCFRDPGVGEFGLHNALWPIGHRFLEVVSPTQAGTSAGRFLDRRGGDGGYMVITQADSYETHAAVRQRALVPWLGGRTRRRAGCRRARRRHVPRGRRAAR